MSQAEITDRRFKTVSEARNVAVDFYNMLDTGELLTGTPTVEEITTSALTLANKAINSTTQNVNGASRAAGQVVTFKVTGGSAGVLYKIKITVSTDATPAQTFIRSIALWVGADPT